MLRRHPSLINSALLCGVATSTLTACSGGGGVPLLVLGGNATFTVSDACSPDARGLLFGRRRVELYAPLRPHLTVGYEKVGDRSDLRLGAASDVK